MYRTLPFILLAGLAGVFPSTGAAQDCASPEGSVVEAVELVALENAPEADVRAALDVEPGETVRPLSLTRLEDAVLELGWFATASAVITEHEDGCILRVRLREYPPVEEIRFPGMKAFDGGSALLESIETRIGTPANRLVVEEDAERIARIYHDAGFEAARVVDAEIEDDIVTFRIAEGRIARVDVVGAKRTGARRVKQVLGLRKGDLYNSRALIEGQSKLYRTGLFSLVGFGVEPVGEPGENPEGKLVLTVTVGELENPYSRTELFTTGVAESGSEISGLSAAAVEARIRNIGGGHSLVARVDLLGLDSPELARSGFDGFYRATADAEIRLFRAHPSAGGGRGGLALERVKGRVREDLDLSFSHALGSARAGADVPVVTGRGLSGVGTFTAIAGWRVLDRIDLPGGERNTTAAPWGRGEAGFELEQVVGLETPARLQARAGVELNAGHDPFSYLLAEGSYRIAFARIHRFEARADGGVLTGREVPFWREFALGDSLGPKGFGPDFAFGRIYGRGALEYSVSLSRDLLSAAVGWEAAAWARPAGLPGGGEAHSASLELRAGPDFASLRAGVAFPLNGPAANQPWWYAGLIVASPY